MTVNSDWSDRFLTNLRSFPCIIHTQSGNAELALLRFINSYNSDHNIYFDNRWRCANIFNSVKKYILKPAKILPLYCNHAPVWKQVKLKPVENC